MHSHKSPWSLKIFPRNLHSEKTKLHATPQAIGEISTGAVVRCARLWTGDEGSSAGKSLLAAGGMDVVVRVYDVEYGSRGNQQLRLSDPRYVGGKTDDAARPVLDDCVKFLVWESENLLWVGVIH